MFCQKTLRLFNALVEICKILGKKFGGLGENAYLCTRKTDMVPIVQLVRASDCGSECRRFESVWAPQQESG